MQWASLLILFLAILSLSSQTNNNVSADVHRHHVLDHIIPDPMNSTGQLVSHTSKLYTGLIIIEPSNHDVGDFEEGHFFGQFKDVGALIFGMRNW